MATEIVSQEDFNDSDHNMRTVRLSSSYDYEMHELLVTLYSNGYVKFTRLSSEKEARTWTLSSAEAQGFIAACGQFQADYQCWQEAEVVREQAQREETMRLAQAHGIEVTPVEGCVDSWAIRCEAYHTYWSNCTYANSIESLRTSIDHIIKSITAK